jgi:hypothetical protein
MRIKSTVHPEGALCEKGASLTYCWCTRGRTRNTQKHTNWSEILQHHLAHQKHGASWGCTE